MLREESRAVHGELLSLLSMRGGGSTAAKGEEEAARQLATTTRYGQGSKQGGTGGGEREAERDAEWGARDSGAATRRQADKDRRTRSGKRMAVATRNLRFEEQTGT